MLLSVVIFYKGHARQESAKVKLHHYLFVQNNLKMEVLYFDNTLQSTFL